MKNKSSVFFLFLTVLFFLSGACGLAYEMIWVRKLGLIFGNTTFAISTILAVFMGGLGLGSLFFGRQIDKKGNPLFWYAFLEIGIGLFCFFTPWLWVFIEMFYVWVYQAAHLSFWQFSLFRFLLCFAFLFIPTFLMGGTLPVLTKFLIRDCRQTTKVVGFLYGVNTLGAVLGVLITSFFAIYVFGLNGTVFVTSGINVLIGLAMFFLLRLKVFLAGDGDQLKGASLPVSETVDIQDDSQGRLSQEKLLVILLAAFAFSGFTSMAYELCWTKVLALCLGSSVYSFALMLASFLTGLALGSLLIGWLAKKIPIDLYVFGLAQVFVALFVLWGVNTFDQMPFYFLQFFILFGKNSLVFHVAKFVLASVIILLPTICIGCTFAIVAQMLNRSSAKTGET
ncbi:MAG: fused MFS/spermidine synthase, partial [Candidatus Omnitrophota bacterium]